VASLAVLADDEPDWRPQEFQRSLFGCATGIRFPTVKLLDFAADETALEASTNPFSKVVLAHLKARETHGNPTDRHAWKVRLVRGLYERGFSAKDVRELFRLIDWLMELPPPLANLFRKELDEIQEENRMPYVTSIERLGRCDVICSVIESLLQQRFGDDGVKLMPEIREIYDEAQLLAIHKALVTAASPDEVRPLLSPSAS
jgi:hypothetical protein